MGRAAHIRTRPRPAGGEGIFQFRSPRARTHAGTVQRWLAKRARTTQRVMPAYSASVTFAQVQGFFIRLSRLGFGQ